jgi:hypothetical protein
VPVGRRTADQALAGGVARFERRSLDRHLAGLDHDAATVAGSNDPAGAAAHRFGHRLDYHPDTAKPLGNLDDVEPLEPHEGIKASQ